MAIQDLDEIKTIQGGGQKKKEAMFESWIQELRRNGEEPTWQHILDVLTKLVIEKPIQDIKRRYRECVFCVHVLRGQKIGYNNACYVPVTQCIVWFMLCLSIILQNLIRSVHLLRHM